MKPTHTLLAALLLAPLAALHAAKSTSEEKAAAEQWAQSNVFTEPAKWPFSFTLAGISSDELLGDWKRTDATRQLDAQRRERTLITVNSWNEWTETSYLQPCTLYGYGYLEALKRVFGADE